MEASNLLNPFHLLFFLSFSSEFQSISLLFLLSSAHWKGRKKSSIEKENVDSFRIATYAKHRRKWSEMAKVHPKESFFGSIGVKGYVLFDVVLLLTNRNESKSISAQFIECFSLMGSIFIHLFIILFHMIRKLKDFRGNIHQCDDGMTEIELFIFHRNLFRIFPRHFQTKLHICVKKNISRQINFSFSFSLYLITQINFHNISLLRLKGILFIHSRYIPHQFWFDLGYEKGKQPLYSISSFFLSLSFPLLSLSLTSHKPWEMTWSIFK